SRRPGRPRGARRTFRGAPGLPSRRTPGRGGAGRRPAGLRCLGLPGPPGPDHRSRRWTTQPSTSPVTWRHRHVAGTRLTKPVAAVDAPAGAGGFTAPAHVVLLAGDAGVGKTRLLTELRDHAVERGWQVAAGHCVDFGD